MAEKNVQSVKNSLKFKAVPKSNLLTVRVGVKKYQIPVEARMLSNEGYMFLSFPATSELYRIDGKALNPMPSSADATEAYEKLNPGRRARRRRGRNAVEMPDELQKALKGIPAGYKLSYGPDGEPRLVKKRKRRTKKEMANA